MLKILGKILDNIQIAIGKINEHANIHGIQHAVDLKFHPLERLFWISIVCLAVYGTINVSSTQYKRYDANPTVISLERDYRDWNGTVPAITFCYHKRIDETRAQNLIKRLWNVEKYEEDYNYFMDFIKIVVNMTNSDLTVFNRFSNDKRLEFANMISIAKEVHPTINSVISSFDNNVDFFLMEIITEKGICYTANSVTSSLISTTRKEKDKFVFTKPLSCYFLKNQCYMKLDVHDPTVLFAIHSPYEVPTDNTIFYDMGLTDEIESTYNMLETVASPALKELNVNQRKCFFYDETNANLPAYSVNVCLLTCKAKAAQNICGCRPYFYPFMNGTVCTASGLICLANNNWPEFVVCSCPKNCAEIVYTQNSLKKINWAVDGGIPFTQKSSFRYEILAPRMRLRRDVLFSFEDLIVSFGGIAALFIGSSVWGVCEMSYFIILVTATYIYMTFVRIMKKIF